MQNTESFDMTMPSHSARTLKIEADGDAWKKRIKPKIRIMEKWLERAGFTLGHHVRVTHVASGVIELRFIPSEDHAPQPVFGA